MEPNCPNMGERKRVAKQKSKFKERQTAGMGGTVAQKIAMENAVMIKKNKDRESRQFLQNDMILIWTQA